VVDDLAEVEGGDFAGTEFEVDGGKREMDGRN